MQTSAIMLSASSDGDCGSGKVCLRPFPVPFGSCNGPVTTCCSSCASYSCLISQAPACGGTCPSGQVCAVTPVTHASWRPTNTWTSSPRGAARAACDGQFSGQFCGSPWRRRGCERAGLRGRLREHPHPEVHCIVPVRHQVGQLRAAGTGSSTTRWGSPWMGAGTSSSPTIRQPPHPEVRQHRDVRDHVGERGQRGRAVH